MMIHRKVYDAPPVNLREILRYAGAGEDCGELSGLIRECMDEVSNRLTYKVCWRDFPVMDEGGTLDIGFLKTESKDLKKNLSGCERVILFAATVGMEIDRLIIRYGRISPVKALLFQAIGAERIESLTECFACDVAQQAMEQGKHARIRFSPGYGDFPLSVQKQIFDVLECQKQIGLTLNASLLMSPSKSVTALIGIGETPCITHSGCGSCKKIDCTFRDAV